VREPGASQDGANRREQPRAPRYLPDPAQAVVPGAQRARLLEAFHAHSVAGDLL
jgi:hypothetical protein